MLGLDILDVAIGLFFGYLVLSLAVTAANELFAAWFKRRAWMLRKGVASLLDDPALTARLYGHPMIRSLSAPRGPVSRILPGLVGEGPSYMSSRAFAMALLDILPPDSSGAQAPAAAGGVERVLALLRKDAGTDTEKFRTNVETWFNDSMERVSGWYKRRTQVFLLLWAAVVTIGTNADTIVIARALWSDPALRQTLVERAEGYVAAQQPRPGTEAAPTDEAPPPPPLPPDQQAEVDFQEASAQFDAAVADLAELQLPIGWEAPAAAIDGEPSLRLVRDDATDDWPGAIWAPGGWERWKQAAAEHAVGWLLTMMAVSLGAPFWFDTLNRIIAIRAAGKAPEESPKPSQR